MMRLAGYIASAVVLAAQGASNALYAYQLGHTHLPGYTMTVDGLVLAAAACGVTVLEAVIAKRLLAGDTESPRFCGVVLAASLAFSLSTMVAHVSKLQRVQAEAELDQAAKYDRALETYRRLERDASRLGTPRPATVIDAEIKSLRIDPQAWRESRECTRPTNRYQIEACAPVAALHREASEAAELAALRPKMDGARAALDTMSRPESRGAAESLLSAWLPWLATAVLGMFATFGFALSGGARRASLDAPAQRASLQAAPIMAGPGRARKAGGSRRGAASLIVWYGGLDRQALPAGISLDADGWCTAGQEALASALGVAKPTVSRWLATLGQSGEIEVRTSPRGTVFRVASATL